MARRLEDVYCTLLMSDSYLPGAAVLAHSLRDAGTTKKLAVLVTLDTVSADTVTELKSLYDYVLPVDRIRNPNPANLFLMGRPDLLYAFTKIALWRQTQFRKIVYLDADVVALRAIDELFDIDAPFAAASDVGWPDAFNTGVMVLNPDMGEYWALQTMTSSGDSFDGADQGLLNQYFEHRNWHRLKFTYNTTPNAQYQWEPAYRYYKRDISAVHFIGKDKPWTSGRKGPGGHGVYNELLARWWAVHDRHLKQAPADPTSRSDAGSGHRPWAAAGQHMHGETSAASSDTPTQHITSTPEPVVEPEVSATSTEMPLSEPGEAVENIDQGLTEPIPTTQQRMFSAPEMEWDATRFEPPSESRPEAANFPSQQYTFSDSHELFKAPQAYPEPPKDMWYQVPEDKPKPAEPPKPIFPWEREHDRPIPTRVFAEDLPPPEPKPPTPAILVSPSSLHGPPGAHAFSTVHYEEEKMSEEVVVPGPASPERVSSPKTADQQWQDFQQNNTNAWDSVPGIDTYVRAIMESQSRRGKPQVLQQTNAPEEVSSPTLSRKKRRESLILTDFPSAVERPSLPVTPAPVPRPTFWGEERDDQGELPQAEGVPDQQDWNPEARLEQLRRSSLVEFEHLKSPNHPKAPLREVPEHSVDLGPKHPSINPGGGKTPDPPGGTGDTDGANESNDKDAADAPTSVIPNPSSINPNGGKTPDPSGAPDSTAASEQPKASTENTEASVIPTQPSINPGGGKTPDPPGGPVGPAVSKASNEPPGYFALVKDKDKDAPATGTPSDMPLFTEPKFGGDGAGGDAGVGGGKVAGEEVVPREEAEELSPTQTRS